MAVLDQFTLTGATPKRDNTSAGRFRRRLLEALDLQAEIAGADRAGTTLLRSRPRWVKNESGSKELCTVPVRLRRWWWKDETGKTYLSLRSGARLLEIAPGKTAIEVGVIEDLPAKLALLRDAVIAGELDKCIEPPKGLRPDTNKRKSEAATTSRSAAAKA